MKKVAVIGSSGNMGKRYAMILEQYCNCEVVRIDWENRYKRDGHDCDGFIIATPTKCHLDDIEYYSHYDKPILCEKPISKDIDDLKEILDLPDLDLSMINQYGFLDSKDVNGGTYYNYFKTGSDSLYWDCINIIGTARNAFEIKNNSLIWECTLNSKRLDLRDMDHAYAWNIESWVKGWRNKEYILPTHQKVLEAINDQKS